MTGTVYDYNQRCIKIVSGEMRISIFFRSSEEYQECLKKGMGVGKQVIFDNNADKIQEFF